MKRRKGFIIVLLGLIVLPGVYFLFFSSSNEDEKEALMRQVMPEAQIFEELEKEQAPNCTAYQASANSTMLGYVMVTSQEGYRSDISVITGIDTEMNITGVRILEQKETKGKGSLITESTFLEQFAAKGNTDNVDLISGATVSSAAVEDCVNEALEAVKRILS